MALRRKQNKLRDCNHRTITSQSKAPPTSDKHSLDGISVDESIPTRVWTSSTNSSTTTNSKLAKSSKNFVRFSEMFADTPQYSAYKTQHSAVSQYYPNCSNKGKGFNDDRTMNSNEGGNRSTRLLGGTLHRSNRDQLILSPSECKPQPIGLKFFDVKQQVNVINLQLNDVQRRVSVDGLMLPQQQNRKVVESRTRATQTLFRESSAQTMPYLPAVSNNSKELEVLELFKLPTILPGTGPPGLYEIEVLERARKRWAFAKALKENFRKQLATAREQAKLQYHQHILEAFEWEHWIEREENLQECQMLRLDLLIRMFDKRERDMHSASKTRIQKSTAEMEAKRKAALKKSEIEHNRAIRRLAIKHSKQSRTWRKEHITHELGDPSSEFYAPKMRHGVSPTRRHYIPSRSGFDMRMDDLEKKAIEKNAENLKCPFAKIREWSKPKKVVQEVEQNFCSESNLNKLYESLRTLRETTRKQKYKPLCLKTKEPIKQEEVIKEDFVASEATSAATIENLIEPLSDDTLSEQKHYKAVVYFDTEERTENLSKSLEELRQQKQAERLNTELIHKEMRSEELESLISSYEGNTIGWLMRFLSEEMCRLKEQRQLQFFAMKAKRQRWHREAAEAGLRQKENSMRESYEKLYEDCDPISGEITEKFLNSILCTDIKDYGHQKAERDVLAVAEDIDKEIFAWLESFGEVQNPLNYHALRHALKDIVVPDIEKILYRRERDDCIDFIINNVLLEKVYHDMEPYEVASSVANSFVDRLLDNDLYLSSTDCSTDSENCNTPENEAKSIIRKIIRYSVPGRRWFTDEERIAAENISDILDLVFDKVLTDKNFISIDMPHPPHVPSQGAHTDLVYKEKDMILTDHLDDKNECFDKVRFNIFNSEHKIPVIDITKDLKRNENLLLNDPDNLSNDDLLVCANEYVPSEPKPKLSILRYIPSTHNLSIIKEFCSTPNYTQTSSEERLELKQMDLEEVEDEISLSQEDIGEQLEIEEEFKAVSEDKHPEINIEELIESEELREIRINDNIEEILIDAESEQEDDTNSIMQVSFSYNPEVDFSVAVPSNGETDNENVERNDTINSHDEKK